MAALRALHPDREARGYSQKRAHCATRKNRPQRYSLPQKEPPDVRHRPYSLYGRPGTPVVPASGGASCLPLTLCEGGRRADRRNLPSSARAHSRTRGAFRRAIAAFSLRRRAALCPRTASSCLRLDLRGASRINRSARASGRPHGPPSASSSRGGRLRYPPGGARRRPSARLAEPRPRAPHLPHSKTPLEAPLMDRLLGQ